MKNIFPTILKFFRGDGVITVSLTKPDFDNLLHTLSRVNEKPIMGGLFPKGVTSGDSLIFHGENKTIKINFI